MTATLGASDETLASLADCATIEQRLARARADAQVLIYGGSKPAR